MSLSIAIYGLSRKKSGDRGSYIARSLEEGFKAHGKRCRTFDKFDGKVCADVCLFYGWIHELTDKLCSKYVKSGSHVIFIDLGYWDRGTRGNYRFSVDGWDTKDKLARNCPSDRYNSLRKNGHIKPRDDWSRNSKQILVAGMSDKAAWTHGYKYMQWENQIAQVIRDLVPEYNVVIRPKPNNQNRGMPRIEDVLKETHFVVSHHSNTSVDCLVAGIPYFAVKGVGTLLSPTWLTREGILQPLFPATQDKEQLLYDIAYAQWTPSEMSKGTFWDHAKGLLK